MAKKTTSQSKQSSATAKNADVGILKHPRITEKAANGGQYSIYLFDVAVNATKPEIAKAFQMIYKKAPLKVNTLTVARRSYFRQGMLSFGAKGKKAYIFLPKGTTIDIM